MLDDIVFGEGEIQNFIVELDAGTLNSPSDIIFDNASNANCIIDTTRNDSFAA